MSKSYVSAVGAGLAGFGIGYRLQPSGLSTAAKALYQVENAADTESVTTVAPKLEYSLPNDEAGRTQFSISLNQLARPRWRRWAVSVIGV